MFSCFGTKSSSQEEIYTKRHTTTARHQNNEFRRTSHETRRRRTVSHCSTTQKFTTQATSDIRSNVRSRQSSSISSRIKIDGTPFKIQPVSTSVSSRRTSTESNNRALDQKPGSSYFNKTEQIQNDGPQNVKGYKVLKTNKYYDNVRGDCLPVYQTHSRNRGQVLIINNIKFHKENLERKGALKDEKDINDVLSQIGFKVEKYRNVKKSDIKNLLKQFISNKKKLVAVDICLIVVMSHGTNNNIPGGYTEVMCVDGERISTEEIIDFFNESKCQFLKDKPKIFIFQCCRNNLYESDAAPIRIKPEDKSNTLIAYSTVPGFSSNRHVQNGTWYIQTICKIFSEYAHKYHIEDLLKLVDAEMKNIDPHMKQVSSFENRGFSRCFLHPR